MASIDWMWVAENPIEAADEIERLRAALEGIVKHMDANGMQNWPVAKKAKEALRLNQQRTDTK
jgi:hypothetical protein